jgi:hypothetical protein
VVIIVRRVQTSLGRKICRHIGKHGPRVCASFEGADIGERLQRRTGGTSTPSAINLADPRLEIVT